VSLSRIAVLDTNVIVSGALKERSAPAVVIGAALDREIVIVVCPAIVAEYRDVFARPKFAKFRFPPAWFDRLLIDAMHRPDPVLAHPSDAPDPSDLVFLETAREVGACVVTGNTKDFPARVRGRVTVCTPTQYADWLFDPNR